MPPALDPATLRAVLAEVEHPLSELDRRLGDNRNYGRPGSAVPADLEP